jgi:catechol 2,3-dioxygenase-like lactoylglutathione lyase family enzyme
MTHRSKLGGFIIDCATGDLDAAARFWEQALGMERHALPGAEGERYVKLTAPWLDLHVEVQKVNHPSRVHLDIETDDIEAEVQRLEGLGAHRVAQTGTWWVMEAPTGQRFCVVRAGSPGFAARARSWA